MASFFNVWSFSIWSVPLLGQLRLFNMCYRNKFDLIVLTAAKVILAFSKQQPEQNLALFINEKKCTLSGALQLQRSPGPLLYFYLALYGEKIQNTGALSVTTKLLCVKNIRLH